MWIWRSAAGATSWLWVTITRVSLRESRSRCSSWMISSWLLLSRLPVGSSARSRRGVVGQRARDGDALALADGELRGAVRAAVGQAHLLDQSLRRAGALGAAARGPRTSGSGCSRAPSAWASDRTTGRRSRPAGAEGVDIELGEGGLPRKKTSPSVGRSSPPRMCKSVLLPQPLGPVIATDSASLISSETPRRAWTCPSG